MNEVQDATVRLSWPMLTLLVSFTSTEHCFTLVVFQGGTNSLAYRHDVGQR